MPNAHQKKIKELHQVHLHDLIRGHGQAQGLFSIGYDNAYIVAGRAMLTKIQSTLIGGSQPIS
jgi:hypothetical protein